MKGITRSIYREFIEGGILLALGPVVIVLTSFIFSDTPINFLILITTFLLNYAIYVFDRFLEKERANKFRIFSIIIAILLLINNLFYLNHNSRVTVVVLLLVGLSYSLFFKKITIIIPGFKSLLVAIMFPLPLLVTYFQGNISYNNFFFYFLFFSLRLLCNTIFCDIKDIDQDKSEGLKTFPTILSHRRLMLLIHAMNLVSALPILYAVLNNLLPGASLLLLLSIPYSILYIYLGETGKVSYRDLANKWADGEFILWFVLLTGYAAWTL